MPELYLIRRRLGGSYIEEVVSADSYEGAKAIAERTGGEVTGTLFDESPIFHDHDYYDQEEEY